MGNIHIMPDHLPGGLQEGGMVFFFDGHLPPETRILLERLMEKDVELCHIFFHKDGLIDQFFEVLHHNGEVIGRNL
jgi:hypothetical protein